MDSKTLYIRNMVCPRCVSAVKETLTKLEIPYTNVVLGKSEIEVEKSELDLDKLDQELRKIGFELIRDKNRKLVAEVKALIVDYIHHSGELDLKINF